MSDFPKPNGSFNLNAYRSMSAYNAHLKAPRIVNDGPRSLTSHLQSERNAAPVDSDFPEPDKSFDPKGYRLPVAQNSNKKPWSSAVFMSKEKVDQWFRDAEAKYKRDKKAGGFDKYDPAASCQPDLSDFVKMLGGTKVTSLKNPIHNPYKAFELEPANSDGEK